MTLSTMTLLYVTTILWFSPGKVTTEGSIMEWTRGLLALFITAGCILVSGAQKRGENGLMFCLWYPGVDSIL